MTTRLVQALVVGIVAVVVFIAASRVRDATVPAAKERASAIGEASSTAAAADLRSAAAALEAYRIERGTYAGATIALLRAYDGALDPAVRIVRADDGGYCLETGSAATIASLAGPGGTFAPAPC